VNPKQRGMIRRAIGIPIPSATNNQPHIFGKDKYTVRYGPIPSFALAKGRGDESNVDRPLVPN